MKSIENLTILDYYTIFRRRVWYIVITSVLVAIATFVYVRRLPDFYRSETTILVSGRLLPTDFIQSLDRLTSNDRIDSVRRQLESRTFLERIVQEFQLTAGGSTVEAASAFVRRSMGEVTILSTSAFRLGFTSTDPTVAQSVTRRIAEMVIQLNQSSVKDRSQAGDQFLEEQLRESAKDMFEKEDALLRFRNQVFAGQQSFNLDTFREVQAQLGTTNARLADAIDMRVKLERRLEEQGQLRVVLSKTQTQQSNLPAAAAAAAVAPIPPSPHLAELVRKRSELVQLVSRYNDDFPGVSQLKREVAELEVLVAKTTVSPPVVENRPVQASHDAVQSTPLPEVDPSLILQAETQGELEKLKREIPVLEKTKAELAARVAMYQKQLNPPPSIAQELATLEREKDAAERSYKVLADRKLSSALAARVDSSEENETFKVLDPAFLPQDPIGPNRQLYLMVGCLGGVLFGFGLAFGRDFLDQSLHTEAEAAAELNLPIMACIPDIQSKFEKKSRKKLPLSIIGAAMEFEQPEEGSFSLRTIDEKIRDVILDPQSPVGEPYRLLHSKLSLMQRERGIKTVLITSAIPNEGKTFAACCLAGVLARERGKKVLLIDADLRTGSATQVLGLNENQPGLNQLLGANYLDLTIASPGNGDEPELVETPDLGGSVRRCADVNLYFLPSGTSPAEPSQLFNIPGLERLIRQAEGLFDWIIIDSPPVLALADAHLLAPLCDATLFVVRSRKTNAAVVKEAIQRIGAERICGLLINRITGGDSNHYYGYYQHPVRRLKS